MPNIISEPLAKLLCHRAILLERLLQSRHCTQTTWVLWMHLSDSSVSGKYLSN